MLGYVAPSALTLTLAALGADAARECTAIDWNGMGNYDDCMVQLKIAPNAAGTLADERCVNIWFYGSADGTNYDEPCTGSDAAVTLGTYHGLKGPYGIPLIAVGTNYEACICSVASFFGGIIPLKWGIVVDNQTNAALNGTEANFAKYITPVYFTT